MPGPMVIGQGGGGLCYLLHVLLVAQFLPQGFGLLETLFTGFFAEFLGRLLPGQFDAFDEIGQVGGRGIERVGRGVVDSP